MPSSDPVFWSELLRRTFERYDDALMRKVAARLIKPRSQWPVEELVARCTALVGDAAVIDRRLQELDPSCRRLLALIGHSRQPRWRLGSLLEMLAALGHAEGPQPVFALFESGLLIPDLLAAETTPRLKNFEAWLGQSSATGYPVFAHPLITARALGEDLGLPSLAAGSQPPVGTIHEADGLEWILRLAVLWQHVSDSPFRRTQQGGFFKRDLDRLQADPLLNAAPSDQLAEIPDAGLLAVALAEAEGLVQAGENDVQAGTFPPVWERGLPEATVSLWAALPLEQAWDPLDGYAAEVSFANPFPSAQLLAILLLARLPKGEWCRPEAVEDWLIEHHPYWSGEGVRPSRRRSWVPTFLLGLAYQLKLVQAARGPEGEWFVRLSPLGRWVLGIAEAPAVPPQYAQTLLVQPNLEVVAYRQGLTPQLIGRLGRFATWKSLGSACLLQLQPDTVYRALESGLTFEEIVQTLERHAMRPTPTAVVESLRTWANKRERITVYPAAALFEFGSADDLNEALARGLAGTRLSDRLAVVTSEADVDFRHFRLTGTRDYGRPPEQCVDVEADGVTLSVDLARSDLLLEAELQRFAEPLDGAGVNGRRRYRLTPDSLRAGRDAGLTSKGLDEWFAQRTGQPLSPAARLLLNGTLAPAAELKRRLVLHVATADLADGLQQWPGTRSLFADRLGPTTLVVAEEHAGELRQQLALLGMDVQGWTEHGEG